MHYLVAEFMLVLCQLRGPKHLPYCKLLLIATCEVCFGAGEGWIEGVLDPQDPMEFDHWSAGNESYWMSAPSEQPDATHTLCFRLAHPLCLVHQVQVQPLQLDLRVSFIITVPCSSVNRGQLSQASVCKFSKPAASAHMVPRGVMHEHETLHDMFVDQKKPLGTNIPGMHDTACLASVTPLHDLPFTQGFALTKSSTAGLLFTYALELVYWCFSL